MEVLDKPSLETESELSKEFTRFMGVVASRRLPSDFIALFAKLRKSDMFSLGVKPQCFAYLVEQSATKVPNHFVGKLLEAIDTSGCAQVVYATFGKSAAEDVFKALTLRYVQLTPMAEEAMTKAFRLLERIGVSTERIATIDMALRAGATVEFMDEVVDLSFYSYHPTWPRPTSTAGQFNDADAI